MAEIEVSFFNNVHDNIPKKYNLEEWLEKTINPPKEWEADVKKYRQSLTRRDKEKIPCVTISAAFNKKRNLNDIKHKNKLICIDVDRFSKSKKNKSNICADMTLVKELFSQHPCTYYAGYSCSGGYHGVYAIIRIYDENDLLGCFNYFKRKFAHIGLNIDNACKDYTRLRFFSVDKEAYLNKDAKYYKVQKEPEAKPELPKSAPKQTFKDDKDKKELSNEEKVHLICEQVKSSGIDITSSYEDWTKIGAALNNEFGELGASWFHILSKNHPDYNDKKVNTKYRQTKSMTRIKINTLFHIANSYGIRW